MHIIFKLQPHTKIFLVFQLTILIFIIDKLAIAAALMLLLATFRLSILSENNHLFREKKRIKNLFMLMTFLIVIQTLFGPGETYVFRFFKIEGFLIALTSCCRLAALFFLLPLLLDTTSHSQIAAGIAAFGINYRAAFVITSALNYLPDILEEGEAIMDAQKLRGMSVFEKKARSPLSILKKIKAYSYLVHPLVLNSMRKAQISSAAMDSRAFGAYKKRTWMEMPKMASIDFFALAAAGVFSILILVLNYSVKMI